MDITQFGEIMWYDYIFALTVMGIILYFKK